MKQLQQGFNDSMPKAESDELNKSAKGLISALQLIFMSKISTHRP